jgi:hypothetical protein
MVETKRCNKCGETKSASDFYTKKHKDGSTYPASPCRACTALVRIEYRKRTNYRHQKAYRRTERGRAIVAKSVRKWQQSHPEKCRQYVKERRQRIQTQDPERWKDMRCKQMQRSRTRKKLPDAATETVKAISEARHSINRLRKAIKKTKDQ